ncbi:unnamed protein product [Caretta caretta]
MQMAFHGCIARRPKLPNPLVLSKGEGYVTESDQKDIREWWRAAKLYVDIRLKTAIWEAIFLNCWYSRIQGKVDINFYIITEIPRRTTMAQLHS